MKRTMFNDPRPKGHAEIVEAMNELGINPSEARAMIDEPGDDGQGGHGWSAEVDAPTEDDDIASFCTLAYDTKEELLTDLKAAGIEDIDDNF